METDRGKESTLHFVPTRRCLLEKRSPPWLSQTLSLPPHRRLAEHLPAISLSVQETQACASRQEPALARTAQDSEPGRYPLTTSQRRQRHQRQTTHDETTSIPLPIRKQPSRQLPTTRTTFAPTHGTPPSRRHHKSLGHHGRREYNGQGDSAARTTLSGAEHSNTARRRFHDTQRGEHAWLWV